ncbi:acyl-CoA dehydrogenase NM domain-like protein [Calocera viscosa TUFC12733]|uniref:Acyl-CoA dehydrogenase NM domain-like protein n=1 Tax=Calocera viscosa (strain TUFC12733) TaxID=1330018 RepID=A0A167FJS5_CALVF|nr:acyl-CoA dehydrogenase NM domain-like protein [Calocera viscosa TUFC12733]KZO89565.1 acyl-CoA dehydrogenase NM domain-like protein [Calocera viscosa TUFC12733]
MLRRATRLRLAPRSHLARSLPATRRALSFSQVSAAPNVPAGFALELLQNHNPDWTESQRTVRQAVADVVAKYDDEFWLECDNKKTFPHQFVKELADGGWLGICMPVEYGGSAMGISEAAVMMQTIAETGGCLAAASSIHMNIFGLEPVVKFGSKEQKDRMLPPLIRGEERACFGVTEPNSGSDTLKLQTRAVRKGDRYEITGSKMWISTAQHAHKILLLARTTPLEEVKKPNQGLSIFYTDLDRTKVEVTEIPKMGRSAIDTNMLFFDGWSIPAEDRIGEEGDGFKMILHGMNAERVLLAAESLGIGYAGLRRGAQYSIERNVFGRPIGQNQGIQHPLADSWMNLEGARLMTYQAAKLYDEGFVSGEYANAAKYLASEAAFKAVERALLSHGGVGYAKEYHVERYLREVILPRIAPISQNMILNYIAQRVLGQPKSY